MHIKSTDRREREWEALKEATGESTTSGAVDVATRYYLRKAGENAVDPRDRLVELMQLGEEQGSATPAEITEVLDVQGLPVEYQVEQSGWPHIDLTVFLIRPRTPPVQVGYTTQSPRGVNSAESRVARRP